MDTQRELLDAGVPKRLKSDRDVAVPFYYSGKSPGRFQLCSVVSTF